MCRGSAGRTAAIRLACTRRVRRPPPHPLPLHPHSALGGVVLQYLRVRVRACAWVGVQEVHARLQGNSVRGPGPILDPGRLLPAR